MLSKAEFENIRAMLKGQSEDRALALSILDKRKDIRDPNNTIPYALLFRDTNIYQEQWMTYCPGGYNVHVKPLLNSGFITVRSLFKVIIKKKLNIECFDMFINELKTKMWYDLQAADYNLVKEIDITYKANGK